MRERKRGGGLPALLMKHEHAFLVQICNAHPDVEVLLGLHC